MNMLNLFVIINKIKSKMRGVQKCVWLGVGRLLRQFQDELATGGSFKSEFFFW